MGGSRAQLYIFLATIIEWPCWEYWGGNPVDLWIGYVNMVTLEAKTRTLDHGVDSGMFLHQLWASRTHPQLPGTELH